jgi:hypothetical protein
MQTVFPFTIFKNTGIFSVSSMLFLLFKRAAAGKRHVKEAL